MTEASGPRRLHVWAQQHLLNRMLRQLFYCLQTGQAFDGQRGATSVVSTSREDPWGRRVFQRLSRAWCVGGFRPLGDVGTHRGRVPGRLRKGRPGRDMPSW